MELYTAGTGNGQRAAIAVNECGVSCKIHVLNLGQGDQKAADYLKINPTGRIPTLIDPEGPAGKPLVFKDYPSSRVMDVGNTDYQQAGVARVIADAHAGGFDGIFLDDANAQQLSALGKLCIHMFAGALDSGWPEAMRDQAAKLPSLRNFSQPSNDWMSASPASPTLRPPGDGLATTVGAVSAPASDPSAASQAVSSDLTSASVNPRPSMVRTASKIGLRFMAETPPIRRVTGDDSAVASCH